ncbi:hypothetical protein CONCODRAFT_165488 [Conidiobolus coronatus NRRL 28638]|uniref:Uncharacterized protein n=1 Tax=Conidiobolus coronatus (strain ATCC 28846 / CBS 209.66 / NRRL 28638) TaxID=796925 RepID=A0A137P483_CONC2|nr:hypothetical protein CONCODRAFT_165488 [Conidiobolus coronatus NRRL 28638]|eukprot:KXN69731.1 hypothetical protein CONCODRAFT_165488 [Conidiobolus coronatus NRRL 28638]
MFSNKINIKKPKLESGNGDGRSISGSLGNTSFNSISPAASRRSDSRSRSLTPPVRSPPRYYQGLPLDTTRVSSNNSILSEEDELYNNSKFTIYKTKLNIIMQVLLQDLDKFERTYKEYKLSYDPNWLLFIITTTNEILIYINTPYESKPIQLTPEPTETLALSLALPNSQILESLILTCTRRGLIKVFSLKQINQTNDFGYSKSLIENQFNLVEGEIAENLVQLKDFELLLITNYRLISITLNPLNTNNLLEINYNLFNEVNISEFSIGNYNTNTEQTSILLNSTNNELIIGKLGRNEFKVNLTNTQFIHQISNKLNISDINCIKLEKLKLIGDQQFIILFSTKLSSVKREKHNSSEFEFDDDEEEFDEDSQLMGDSLDSSYNQDGSQGTSKIKLGLAHFYQSFEDLKLLSTSFITNSERVMSSFKTSEYKLELNIMSPELAVITVNDSIVILKELTQDTIGYKSTKYEKWLGYEILPLSTLTPNNNHQLKLIAQTNSPNYSLLALNYLGKLEFNLNSKSFPSTLNFNFELEFVKFEYLKNLIQSHFKELNNYQSPINFLKLINLQNFKIELIEGVVLSIGEELFKGGKLRTIIY